MTEIFLDLMYKLNLEGLAENFSIQLSTDMYKKVMNEVSSSMRYDVSSWGQVQPTELRIHGSSGYITISEIKSHKDKKPNKDYLLDDEFSY